MQHKITAYKIAVLFKFITRTIACSTITELLHPSKASQQSISKQCVGGFTLNVGIVVHTITAACCTRLHGLTLSSGLNRWINQVDNAVGLTNLFMAATTPCTSDGVPVTRAGTPLVSCMAT